MSPPEVRVPRDKRFPLMSLLIYDLDAPYPYDRSESPYLHYVRANIACCEESAVRLCKLGERHGDETVPYEPPTPPKHIPHCYRVEAVGHREPIDTAEVRKMIDRSGRSNFDLPALRKRFGLAVLDKRFFMSNGKNKAFLADGNCPQS